MSDEPKICEKCGLTLLSSPDALTCIRSDCPQQLALEGSWSVLGLPPSHYHAQLSNFDWDAVHPPSLHKHIQSFLSEIQEGKNSHLLLTGSPGIGKSHIGIGVYRAAISLFGTQLATWISVPDFCQAVKISYGGGGDPFEIISQAKNLVVLDDLFGRELSGHEISQILARLIDTCYQNDAAMFITMNPAVGELGKFLQPHEVSRILANSKIIPVKADRDWRRG